ncbi:MAG: hypothetical protein DRG71_02375 [Deltaproteobacteria bacterium]|nr:MAG: hypothetical protein DRG71_02375 [Deltaproteobacteria bacterium]
MDLVTQIDLCMECEICSDVCQSYLTAQKQAYLPISRLKAAGKILQGEKASLEEIEGLYTCLKCERCTKVCPQEIDMSQIVRKAQSELLKKGDAPLLVKKVKEQMEEIRKTGNPKLGAPEKRWEWLPEKFPVKESETLLFVGCMPSYWLKDIAISSYLLLRKLAIDFTMTKEEVCCGHYLYNMGEIELAREQFIENIENFNRLGIRRIITLCPGCYRTFKDWLPELIGSMDLEVLHIVQVLLPVLKEKGDTNGLKYPRNLEFTYHDPCELTRVGGIYEEPREILRLCGINLIEMEENKDQAPCCGGGGGVAGNFLDFAVDIAAQVLDNIPTSDVITSCPACFLRLSHASKKRQKGKRLYYVSQVLEETVNRSV